MYCKTVRATKYRLRFFPKDLHDIIKSPESQKEDDCVWYIQVVNVSELGTLANHLHLGPETQEILVFWLKDLHGLFGSAYYFPKEELVEALSQ